MRILENFKLYINMKKEPHLKTIQVIITLTTKKHFAIIATPLENNMHTSIKRYKNTAC